MVNVGFSITMTGDLYVGIHAIQPTIKEQAEKHGKKQKRNPTMPKIMSNPDHHSSNQEVNECLL